MRRELVVCIAVAVAASARAEEPSAAVVRTFAVGPAKPPTPALSVRLLATPDEQIPGDAAVFYHRALESLIEIRYREEIQALKVGGAKAALDGPNSSESSAMDWLELPADKFPKSEVRTLVGRRSRAIEEARLGTLRETCDWGFRRREEGYSLLLPDIQEMRSLVRWIALKTRLDAEEGRIVEALTGVKVGLGVSRDIGLGDIYIQSLVAVACAYTTLDGLETLIQKPGCPNLYWALAAIPRPLVDMSRPAFGESALIEQEFPMLRRIEGEVWSLETARECGDEFARKLPQDVDGWPRTQSPLTRPAVDDIPAHASQLLTIARDYRRSKRSLLDAGMSADRVESMPMIQVVGLESYRTYRSCRDNVAKWSHLPYWLGAKGWREVEVECARPGPGFPFVRLIPGTQSAHVATLRLERRFAALMIVEGVRLYMASHDGALPPSLDHLTESPALPDPFTGKPFNYKLDGDRAVLDGPAPSGSELDPNAALRYEIRRAR